MGAMNTEPRLFDGKLCLDREARQMLGCTIETSVLDQRHSNGDNVSDLVLAHLCR